MSGRYGDSTRSLKAVNSQAASGRPVAPQPVLAATYHLSADETLDSYGRGSNPTWRQLESALAELEGAAGAVVFGSGMAAVSAVLRAWAPPGSTVVVPADGYYQVRRHAAEDLALAGSRSSRRRARRSMTPPRKPTWCSPRPPPIRRSTWSTCTGWPPSATAAAHAWSSTTPPPRRWVSSRCRWAPTRWWPAPPRPCPVTATCWPAMSQPVSKSYSPPPSANACSPARSWAGSRRGFCCAAWKLPDCDSNANARTPGRWRRCWPATRRCGPCATRVGARSGASRRHGADAPIRRPARSNWPTPRRCTPSSTPASC